MDHYPYKDETWIYVQRESSSHLESIYSIFTEEVSRKKENGGNIVIPVVQIRAPSLDDLDFYDVIVTPHNLRNDTFQLGVITALDTILSLYGGASRADRYTLWLLAVHTEDGQRLPVSVWILTALISQYLRPEYIRRGVMLSLAGDDTRKTSGASLQVYHHSVPGHSSYLTYKA